MKRAGAIVIAQSPDTARYSSMPIAAARAGADLVLPIHEIGRVLADIVAGAPLPEPRAREKGSTVISLGTRAQCAGERNGENATAGGGESMETGDLTDAQHDGRAQMSRNNGSNTACARAEMARLRAAELRRRRQDLSSGIGATAQTVVVARRRAAESLRRARLAHQAADEAAARWGH